MTTNNSPPSCACGCGAAVAAGRKWRKGHHWRVLYPNASNLFEFCEKQNSGCWVWSRATSSKGYGWLGGQNLLAHRLAWEVTHGAIPDGMCVLHSCDNPPCINPEHLWLGTVGDNNRDRYRKGRSSGAFLAASHAKQRAKAHCPAGHPYDETNTYRAPSGSRACIACKVERTRQWRLQRRVSY